MTQSVSITTALALVPGETATSLTDQDWTIAVHRANWMHRQIEKSSEDIASLEQRRWMTAIVLGGLLSRMKANSPHGSWNSLFAKNDTCVVFDIRTAQRYMKLHKEVLKRAKRLKDVDITLIESGQRDERTLAEISKLSSAETLRQAYIDFGVTKPSKSSDKQDPFGGHRNETGGPRKEDRPEVSPAERLDAECQAADEALSALCTDLARFQAQGRLPLVSHQKLQAAKTLLANIIEDITTLNHK